MHRNWYPVGLPRSGGVKRHLWRLPQRQGSELLQAAMEPNDWWMVMVIDESSSQYVEYPWVSERWGLGSPSRLWKGQRAILSTNEAYSCIPNSYLWFLPLVSYVCSWDRLLTSRMWRCNQRKTTKDVGTNTWWYQPRQYLLLDSWW